MSASDRNLVVEEAALLMDKVVLCPSCDLAVKKQALSHSLKAVCPRCHTALYDTPYCSMNGMLAICIAALAMWIPANYFPVIEIHFLGNIRTATLFEAAVAVMGQGYWIVGVAVLLTCVVAPVLLISSVLLQIILVKYGIKHDVRRKVLILLLSLQQLLTQLTMLEICLISLLVSAFQLSDFADIFFGYGTFCLVMLFLATLFLLREYHLARMWILLDE